VCDPKSDNITVMYFDRDDLRASKDGCFCPQQNVPKLEVHDKAYSCCAIRCPPMINIFCPCYASPDKEVVIMPYESTKCCFCCDSSNRIGCCANCAGMCGPISGSPIVYSAFYPQPKNIEAFVAVAQSAVLLRQRGQPPPQAAHMLVSPQVRRELLVDFASRLEPVENDQTTNIYPFMLSLHQQLTIQHHLHFLG
jgi:hypothetical protein